MCSVGWQPASLMVAQSLLCDFISLYSPLSQLTSGTISCLFDENVVDLQAVIRSDISAIGLYIALCGTLAIISYIRVKRIRLFRVYFCSYPC